MKQLEAAMSSYLLDHPKASVVEAIYAVLLDEIIRFQILPDTKLTLSHLAEEFGVSITPVREAVLRLGDLGLVNVGAGKKAIVAGYNESMSRNLREFRYCLESLAAVQACDKASDETLRELTAMVDANIELFYRAKEEHSTELLNQLINEDLRFHRALVAASGNPRLIAQYEKIYPCIVFMRQFFLPFDFKPVEFPEAHRAITQALVTRNPQHVRGSIQLHFQALDSAQKL